MSFELPTPSAEERQRSQKLTELIQQKIREHQGQISFESYMHMYLYTKQLGYYESGAEIFGAQGDFTTSPQRSRFFALAFAQHIKNIQSDIGDFSIVEIGAGSGRFACDLIKALSANQSEPLHYYIVETSKSLISRQQNYLKKELKDNRVEVTWLEDFQQPLECAFVIANEVLDALPVCALSIDEDEVYERCVSEKDGELKFSTRKASAELHEKATQRLSGAVGIEYEQLSQPYNTEINLGLPGFIQQIASFVKRGLYFFIDYGYPRQEYYLPERSMGTLICHYKHVANDQLLRWPGLQDISCNVDFTALAEEGTQAGLSLNCYCTQAHFLLKSDFLAQLSSEELTLTEQSEIKQLMMPAEMGERFQVMVFGKNIHLDTEQFTTRNLLHRL